MTYSMKVFLLKTRRYISNSKKVYLFKIKFINNHIKRYLFKVKCITNSMKMYLFKVICIIIPKKRYLFKVKCITVPMKRKSFKTKTITNSIKLYFFMYRVLGWCLWFGEQCGGGETGHQRLKYTLIVIYSLMSSNHHLVLEKKNSIRCDFILVFELETVALSWPLHSTWLHSNLKQFKFLEWNHLSVNLCLYLQTINNSYTEKCIIRP